MITQQALVDQVQPRQRLAGFVRQVSASSDQIKGASTADGRELNITSFSALSASRIGSQMLAPDRLEVAPLPGDVAMVPAATASVTR